MMCLALPARLIEVTDDGACVGRADIMGTPRTIRLDLIDGAAPGDWLLVRMGAAVARITAVEAAEALRLLRELESLLDAEAAAAGEGET